jgi:hypothetical protein
MIAKSIYQSMSSLVYPVITLGIKVGDMNGDRHVDNSASNQYSM